MNGYNPGVVAVISFYAISGYVMTLLIKKHFASIEDAPRYYLDRVARLAPQYLLWLAITALVWHFGFVQSTFLDHCRIDHVAANIAVLPLNFFMFGDLAGCMFLPQAWSLGLEVTFYIVAPFLVCAVSKNARAFLFAASFAVFVAAYLGAIHTDTWGYRLLPGTLWIFMSGMALADRDMVPRQIIVATVAASIMLYVAAPPEPFNKEVLLGFLIAITMIKLVAERPTSALDDKLGNLSYGIFLNHFVFIFLNPATDPVLIFLTTLPLSVLFAYPSYQFVERPALIWRRRFRMGNEVNLAI